jgi:stage III sporulation protein AG
MENLQKFLKSGKGIRTVVILGILGMCLILVSSIIPKSRDEPTTTAPAESDLKTYAENYRLNLQNDIAEMLGKMEGVGDAEVLLTVSSTEETVYTNSKLTEKIVMPPVNGAFIICTGGKSFAVQEKVISAVSSALGLPTNRIYVASNK